MRRSAAADHVTGQRADRRVLAEVVDLVDDGVYDAASVLAWEVQRTSPGDPNVWLLLARIDHLRERYAAAIYAARMATRLDPSSADAWIVLAQTAVRRERWWTEGLDAALQATALTPDDPEPWTALARLQLAAGERYDAAVAAERAVRLDAGHRGAHVVLGQIALETGEWRHAAAAFRRALELDGDDHDARAGLAAALEAQDIDPADELARYGPPVVLRGRRRGSRAAGGRLGGRISHPWVVDNRRLLIGVGACLVAGLLLGVLIPALGALRGLVGAVAVLLMWYAVRPLRTTGAAEVDVPAADAARDEVIEAAASDSARDDPTAGSPPTLTDGAWGPAQVSSGRGDEEGRGDEDEVAAARMSSGRADEGEVPTGTDDAVPENAVPAEPGADAAAATVDDVGDGAPVEDEPAAAPAALATEDVAGADITADDADVDPSVAADTTDDEPAPADGDAAPAHSVAAPDLEDAARGPDDAAPVPYDPPGEDTERAEGGLAEPVDAAVPPVEEAEAEREVVDLPHDPDALIELSRERLAASDIEAAHAAASRLEAVAPGTVEAHRALGAVALAEHDYDQAREHYGKVLELEPLDQEAHERLAIIGEQRPRGRMRRLMGWR